MNSSTASEASAVVSNVITEPVDPTARTIYSVVTAQPVIEGHRNKCHTCQGETGVQVNVCAEAGNEVERNRRTRKGKPPVTIVTRT